MPLSDLKINFSNTTEKNPSTEVLDDLPPVDTTLDPPPATDDTPPKRGRPKVTPLKPAAPPVTKAQQKEITDELDAFVRLASLAWSVRDPLCGTVLNEQSKQISAALAQVLARNPRLLAMMRGSGWMGDWVALGMAITPVARAVYAHHLAPADEEIEHTDGNPSAPQPVEYPPYIPRVASVGNAAVA